MAIVVLAFSIGCLLAGGFYIGATEADHARQARARQAAVNRRQDVTDYNLRQAIGRLEHLERPSRALLEQMIRRLGRRGSRILLEQLLADATPEQLRRLGQVVTGERRRGSSSPSSPGPRTLPDPRRYGRQPRSSRPAPAPGSSTPAPSSPPASSRPGRTPLLDPPPVGPIDLPPLELPRVLGPLLPPPP